MMAGVKSRLLKQLDEEYEDVSVQMEDLIQSFEYLQEEIEFALEDMVEELDKIREHLNRCSYISAVYAGLMEKHPTSFVQFPSASHYADVSTAASDAEMLS